MFFFQFKSQMVEKKKSCLPLYQKEEEIKFFKIDFGAFSPNVHGFIFIYFFDVPDDIFVG